MKVWFRLVGVIACMLVVCCVVVAGASALPFERHYEMVSPVFTAGFGTPGDGVQAVASDGEAVGFYSPGSFAGAPSGFFLGPDYLARRTATGWSTVPMMTPATEIVSKYAFDLTPSLGLALLMGGPGPNSDNPLNEADFLLHATDTPDTGSGWEFGGSVTALSVTETLPVYESASLDFCHVLVGAEPLLPMAVGTEANRELYEFDRGCAGAPKSLVLVGLNNKGELISRACDTRLGADGYTTGLGSRFSAVSADGSEVFFTACVKSIEHEPVGAGVPHQVFVRLAGSRTLEVSRPLAPVCEANGVVGEVPCNGVAERASADFQGASDDGSRVYFTASLAAGQLPLVPGATDASSNLYMATIGCPVVNPGCAAGERVVRSLTEVSHDPVSGQAANVLGVSRVASDGRRVYFVAGGVLLSGAQQKVLEGEGRSVPQVGAANLYSYDSLTSTMSFVGDLCSGTELSGSAQDIHCPDPSSASDENVWLHGEGQEAQTGGADGRFLVFASYAQLAGNDRNVARDVYRYDAVTERLDRVSLGENGFDDNGNRTVLDERGEVLGARIMPGNSSGDLLHHYESGHRAVSDDGSRVVFTSAEPLSSVVSNGLDNAYEWREGVGGGGGEGSVSLISGGGSSEAVRDVAISSDGAGVFFVTTDGLVPQDTNGLPDVYDARLGEGFSVQSAERRSCEGDACQGALTNPAPLLVPGSVSQAPGGNFVSSVPLKAKKKLKAKKPKKKRRGKGKARAKRSVGTGVRLGGVVNVVVGGGG